MQLRKPMRSLADFSFGAPIHSEVTPTLQWVEVAASFQIPSFNIIGLPGPEVSEARDRIRSAIESIGEEFPRRRVVLNLSPASVRKRGTGSDLAMALAVLHSKSAARSDKNRDRNALTDSPARIVAWGELGLDGRVKPLGQLGRTVFACWKAGVSFLLLPRSEVQGARKRLGWIQKAYGEAASSLMIVGVSNLKEAWELIRTRELLSRRQMDSTGSNPDPLSPAVDGAESAGLLSLSPSLERVVLVSALGSHHLLLLGPKGTGKSHGLEWLIALQPPCPPETRLKAALMEEMRNPKANDQEKISEFHKIPVRRVGSQVRPSALLGSVAFGGIRVGEFSLADGGLLLADELPEWPRDSREALREPLERGKIALSRVGNSVELSARFVLAANGNLCPCGGWPPGLATPVTAASGGGPGYSPSPCRCPPRARKTYLARLSGPILDRMDIVFLNYSRPSGILSQGESTGDRLLSLKERVLQGREAAKRRWGAPAGILAKDKLEDILKDNPEWAKQVERLPMSSLRGRHKVLQVALSLAICDQAEVPTAAHFLEAACYRPERNGLLD